MRQKRCKVCREKFTPSRPMQSVCSIDCARSIAPTLAKKAQAKKDRARREKLKTRSDYIKEAQSAFNRYSRLRDAGRGCISCGSTLGHGSIGGDFDAGHFRSIGSAPHLRFHEDNVHGQCKRCNRYLAGNAIAYRAGLVERIGAERVNALESDNTLQKWSIDDLKAIRDTYKAKAKDLEKYE